MNRHKLIAILVAALAAASHQPILADLFLGYTLLNDAGTIYTVGPTGITDPGSPIPSSAQEVAVPFSVTANGWLHSVDFPISRRSLDPSSTTPRTISLSTDAGGQPGTVIEAWSIVPTLTATLVVLTSVNHPQLQVNTTYWITCHINPTGTAADYWYSNGLGIYGTRLWRKSPDLPWNRQTGSLLPAFRVRMSNVAFGSISGQVRADTNGDNAGDAALFGVTLTLKDGAGNDIDGDPNTTGTQPTTTLTTQNGTYTFSVLPGMFQVVETNPSGYPSLSDSDGGDPDVIGPVTVSAGQALTSNNFVDEQYAAITGSVMADTDNDPNKTGDVALSGVSISLYADINRDGLADGTTPVATTTTDDQGFYTLASVARGHYVVVAEDLERYMSVVDADTEADDPALPADVANASQVDSLIPVSPAAGETDSGNDFVDQPYSWIRGIVIVDTNGDGIGDTRLPDVLLTLKTAAGADVDSDLDEPGIQPTTATTDRVGHYILDFLPAGSYKIVETQPTGFYSISDRDGGDPNVIGDQQLVVLVPGNENAGNDFLEGYSVAPPPRIIRGSVIANVYKTAVLMIQIPLPDVKLTLKRIINDQGQDEDIDGDPVTPGVQPTTTLTGPAGVYVFDDLAAGRYRVYETQPAGFVSVGDKDDVPPDNVTDDVITVDLRQVEESVDNYFLEQKPIPTAASLDYFRATTTGAQGVSLVWRTLVEAQVLGYQLERASGTDTWERITTGLIPASGSLGEGTVYQFSDAAEWGAGTKYRLVEVGHGGEERVLAEAVTIVLTLRPVVVAEGLRIEVKGQPRSLAALEVADQLDGTWTAEATIKLDASGDGSLTLPVDGIRGMRFFRAEQR